MEELKPCPFCGGGAYLTTDTKTGIDSDCKHCYEVAITFVACSVCGARGHDVESDFLEDGVADRWAASAWNLRK